MYLCTDARRDTGDLARFVEEALAGGVDIVQLRDKDSAGEKKFGAGEATITARLPLMVRASPPRFLNFGDAFELPVVLQNQTDKAMDVQLAVRATNASMTAGFGRAVRVPANDRVEVRMPMAAAKPGTARMQAGAVAGAWADAAEVKLPVWTPATTEAFASCSACAMRSAAMNSGLAVSSASTQISLGPAKKSIAQSFLTAALAAVTHRLPGPTIFRTRGTVSVP